MRLINDVVSRGLTWFAPAAAAPPAAAAAAAIPTAAAATAADHPTAPNQTGLLPSPALPSLAPNAAPLITLWARLRPPADLQEIMRRDNAVSVVIYRHPLEPARLQSLHHPLGHAPRARGLHSFSFRLNLSIFCGINWEYWLVSVTKNGSG